MNNWQIVLDNGSGKEDKLIRTRISVPFVNGITPLSRFRRISHVQPSAHLPFGRALFTSLIAFFALSDFQHAQGAGVTENGIKSTLQNGNLAYTPQGTYTLAAGETLTSIECELQEDIPGNGTWTVKQAYIMCATTPINNGVGNFAYPSGTINPCTAMRKYKINVKI